MSSAESAGPLGLGLGEGLGPLPARWYCLDRDGIAMLCKDEDDAREQVIESADFWPGRAPYRAALLGDVAEVRERLRVLVQAVRDANHGAQGEYPFRLLTAQQEQTWTALMAALEGPNGLLKGARDED